MLCNAEDVAFEGAFELTPDLKKKIEYKIQNTSEHIHQLSHKNLDIIPHRFYAKMACIYSVLMWLESKRLIMPSYADRIREGNIEITYRNRASGHKDPQPNYKKAYDYYLSFLLPYPPVGALV